MGITLTGKRVQNTYDSLLKLSSNDNLTSTPQLVGDGLGNDSPIYLSETKVGIGVSPSFQFQTSDAAKIGGNLTVAGNLIVEGTTTQVDSTIVEIGDNMIELAKDNIANIKDIGWYGTIVESGTKYVGTYYDASSGITTPTFYIGLGTTEPSNTASWTVKGKLVIGDLSANGGDFTDTVYIDDHLEIENSDGYGYIELGGSSGGYIDLKGPFSNDFDLRILTGGTNSQINAISGALDITANSGIDLQYQGSNKLTVISTGIDITGNLFVSGGFKDSDEELGTSGQVLSSTGTGTNWVDFEADTAKALQIDVKNVFGATMTKGTVVHAEPTGTLSGNVIEVVKADANVAANMPAIGILNEDLSDDEEGKAVMFGTVQGIDTSSFSVGDELYVSTTAGALTNTKPTATTEEVQKIAVVVKSHASNGLIKVFGAGRSNDVPNLIERSVAFDGGNLSFGDNDRIIFGDNQDFNIQSNGVNTFLSNLNNNLVIQNSADDLDIIFRSDNGDGTSVTDYLVIDGSTGGVNLYHYGTKKFETTSYGALMTSSSGDTILRIEADSDNDNENDNPRIELIQDGANIVTYFGINGSVDNTFTGALANSPYIIASGGFQVVTNNNSLALSIGTSTNATFTGDIYGNLIELEGIGFKGGEGDVLDDSDFNESGVGNTFRWVHKDSGSSGTTWQKVADVTLDSFLPNGCSMDVKVILPNDENGNSASQETLFYSVSFRGADSDVVSYGDAIVYGPDDGKLRVYKSALRTYELQARTEDNDRSIIVEYTITSKYNAKVVLTESITAGTTSGGTAYTASQNNNNKTKFAGELDFLGVTIGDDLRINGNLFFGPGADTTYGGYLTNKGSSAEGISMKVRDNDGFEIYQVWGNGGEAALSFEAVDEQIKLYYSGSEKLNTNTNGVDIFGRLKLEGNYPYLLFTDTQGTDEDAFIANNANGLFFGKTNTPASANDILKLDLSNKESTFYGDLTVNRDIVVKGTHTNISTIEVHEDSTHFGRLHYLHSDFSTTGTNIAESLLLVSSSDATGGIVVRADAPSSEIVFAIGDSSIENTVMKITDGANGVEFFPTTTAEGGHIALRADTDGSYRYAIDNYNDTLRIVRQADADATGGVVVTNVDGNGDFNVLRDFIAGRTGYFTSNSADSRVLYLDQHAVDNGNIIQFRDHNNDYKWEVVGRNNQFYIYNNALTKHSIYINPTNNKIGINGNAAPKALLHITDNTNSYPTDNNNKLVVESDGHTYIGLGSGDSSDVGIHFGDSTAVNRGRLAYIHSEDAMKISANGSVRHTITSNGTVLFNNYNADNKTGTATYLLGTDSSGNIVKTTSLPFNSGGSSKSKRYQSFSGTPSSGTWFPLFLINEQLGPITCKLYSYAHDSVEFSVSEGYSQSNAGTITVLNSVNTSNGAYATVAALRILQDGWVEAQFTWSSGPTVDIGINISGYNVPNLASSLAASTNSNTVVDIVVVNYTGMLSAKSILEVGRNSSGIAQTRFVSNGSNYMDGSGSKLGIGTNNPTAQLEVSAGPVFINTSTQSFSEKLVVGGITRTVGLHVAGGVGYSNYANFVHDDNDFTISTARVSGTGDINLEPHGDVRVEGANLWLNESNAASNYYLSLNKRDGQDGGILWYRSNSLDFQHVNAGSSGNLIWYSYGTSSTVMTLDKSTGNLGLATAPSSKLHIKYAGGSYGSDSTSGFINEATTGRGTMRIRSTTDNPAELFFDVNGGIRWDISCRSGSTPTLNFYPQAATPSLTGVSAHVLELQQDGDVIVTGNGTSGRLGVGTTGPGYDVEVFGTDAKAFVHYGNNSRGGIAAFSSQRVALTTTAASDDLVFGYNSATSATSANFVQRMKIDNGTGHVQVNNALRVYGDNVSDISATNSPTETSVNIGTYTNAYGFIDISSSNANGGWIDWTNANGTDYRGRIRYNFSSDHMKFYAGAGERMQIEIGQTKILNNLEAANTTYSAFIGSASFSWGGNSTSYPTIYGEHPDRWVMYTFPHIAYLKNGVNGHTGSTLGAKIRFASDSSTSSSWDAGVDEQYNAADRFSIGRAGSLMINCLTPNSTYSGLASRDWVVFGSGSRGGGIAINDIAGANYAIYAGGYDLTFSKSVNGTSLASALTILGDNASDSTPDVRVHHNFDVQGTAVILNAATVVSNSSSRVLYLKQNASNAGNIIQFQNQSGTNVWENVGRDNGYYIYNNQGGQGYAFFIRHDNNQVGIKRNTGISYALDVNGAIRATGDVIAFSDKRVKENIVTIDNALDKVTKLRGVSYTRKDADDKSTKVGVIAQEVLDVLPEVVKKDDDGMYSVAYGNMAGVFIEAIKELKAEIEELKKCNCKCNCK